VFGDSLNTDAMYPAFAMKLDVAEAARHVFYSVRPGWTDQVLAGDIVIAGRNFGVGSSRPVAALFRHLGVAGLVAEEFNSLFMRNAVNAGLPALTAPGVLSMFSDGEHGTFDVATGGYRNDSTGLTGQARPLPPLVMDILARGGILPRLAELGYLPTELRDTLRSGVVPTDRGGASA
jgi:3-isopropylmalate/(R)-2-methylmalate dehydratase small subunit